MSDNIKVVVKVRPLISREIEDKLPVQWRVHNDTLYQLDQNARDFGQVFTFDKVYDQETKTSDVYNDVAKPIVQAATTGFNGTIFAYGQTSSGKTYTMTGTEASPGIIPLSVLNLFEIIKSIPDRDFLVRVSYIEIYNETVKDLLDIKKDNIKVHENYDGCIRVDATEKITSSPEEVLEAMKEGESNRQTGTTNMNEKSSRSHSIFQITIESREHIEGTEEAGCVNVSQLNLVDLAGSERAGQTGATGIRFKEGTHINKSLSALALVIKQLSEDPNKFANYRDSKLTRILKNSLGGNAKTSIICAITPAALEETISTLQFATRAKCIKNKPEVNAVATDATMIQTLTKQLSVLQSQLESKKNLEVMLENKKHVEQDLQKKIQNLQKVILNGFGQRANIEQIGGARRKQPLRRITISTLHSIDEDPVPAVPKFCTPTLKYNPLTVQRPSDFAPTQSGNKLESLPEEPPRLITPPLTKEKKVYFGGDIIEIDSDDDHDSTNSTIPTCSPYHKCYNSSKTPPCILRKNCHRAEKNYKEIVEFTEREKLFQPDVVELMEKLEMSTNMTAHLQDEIEILKKNSKDKDLEMEHLLFKIKKTEEEVKAAKVELETYSKELTDREVSYEILKKKAALREEELLSLLDEQKVKKSEDIGKLPAKPIDREPINFMDMSKDISLVNSDNESSVVISNDDECEQLKTLVSTLQDQIIAKGQTIMQLEANIASQNKSIEFLEQSSHQLELFIDNFKEKNAFLENENKLYKSNIDSLNETIQIQKEDLQKAHYDISSLTNTIQELQIKLNNRENLLNVTLSDEVLNDMIANEEKVIANNDNMKNIIHSFKLAIAKRNKEIEDLKSSIKGNNDTQSDSDAINEKNKQIESLNEEINKLKDESNSNIKTINTLMREKSHLSEIEQRLTQKLEELENTKIELFDLNKENILKVDHLTETNRNLLQTLSENTVKEQEYLKLNSELHSKLDEMSCKILQTEQEINIKNDIIASLTKINNDKQEYDDHAKSALHRLKNIITILNGDLQNIPEFIEDCVNLFNIFSSGLSVLEEVANETVSVKSAVVKENENLKCEITNLRNKLDLEQTNLQNEINKLQQTVENNLTEISNLKENNRQLLQEIETKYKKELSIKTEEYVVIQKECDRYKEEISQLKDDLLQKQDVISTFIKTEAELESVIKDLQLKLQHANIKYKDEQQMLETKEENLIKALHNIEQLKSGLMDKTEEVTLLREEMSNHTQDNNKQMGDILNKLTTVMDKLNVDETSFCENGGIDSYHIILLGLDKIISVNVNNEQETQEKEEIKKKLEFLLNDNESLKNTIVDLENNNQELSAELEKFMLEKECLCDHIIASNKLLEQLKEDLKEKIHTIGLMEDKAKQCKEQFVDVDILLNQKIQDLRLENENLKDCLRKSLDDEKPMQANTLSEETYHTSIDSPSKITNGDPNKQHNLKRITPPSLLTICCNKIVDVMESDATDPYLASPSGSDTEIRNSAKSCPKCESMSLELRILQQEKCSLLGIIEQTEKENKELLIDQEYARREVKMLLESALELQKKLSSHKTNLSILTATTYAENRSLKSQVLALKHHHNRLLNVCQGDIPDFKKQLRDLFFMLKDDYNTDSQNANFKRYSLPDVLDNNTTVCNFKNESTLDGELLMLDTNVTLTTTGDNTLVGCDQTCLDITQTMFNEVPCQNLDPNQTEPNINSHISLLQIDSQNMVRSLEILKEENRKLKALVNKLSCVGAKVDAQSSPIKHGAFDLTPACTKCDIEEAKFINNNIEEVERLSQKLEEIQYAKNNIEMKYNNLVLEMPNTDALVTKLNALEKDHRLKSDEIAKLSLQLSNKNKELKKLFEENDSLSTQVMESISEADDLNKELSKLKLANDELAEKIQQLESNKQDLIKCTRCHALNIETTQSVSNADKSHAKLNRSLSDSETSSRFNKICTLQSELYAGREDCKVLTEQVETIKQHLNCSHMDLDESMGECGVIVPKNVSQNQQSSVCNMPDIQEENTLDIYNADRKNCHNYYIEICGEEREIISNDLKIVDILKLFHNNLLKKHGTEIESLVKTLKEYEDSKDMLQSELDCLNSKYSALSSTLEEKENSLDKVLKLLSEVKSNIKRINNDISNMNEDEDITKIINKFKQSFLKTLDYEFGTSSVNVFEVLIEKYQEEIRRNKDSRETQVSNNVENVSTLEELKNKLAEKESECNLLQARRERMLEISSAVTLDVVSKEQAVIKSLTEGCQKLLQHELITSDLVLTESAIGNINIIFENIINKSKSTNNQLQTENERLSLEVNMAKTILENKETELIELKAQNESLRDVNNNVLLDLADREQLIQKLKTAHEDLSKSFDSKIQENINKLNEIDKLTEELTTLKETINSNESLTYLLAEKDNKISALLHSVEELEQNNAALKVELCNLNQTLNQNKTLISTLSVKEAEIKQYQKSMKDLQDVNAHLTDEITSLKESITKKESLITSLSEKNAKTTELVQSIHELQQDNERLISINQMISRERESYSIDLEKSSETIKQNNAEIEKMTADILVLRESVKDATSIIQSLKQEIQKLTSVKSELELSLDEKKRECVRLEMNIKTHDKTAELQSKMIMRLKKEKEEGERQLEEYKNKIIEVSEKYDTLQKESDTLKLTIQSLETRVSELQETTDKPRMSIESGAESTRRRRQSLHDSKRLLGHLEEQRSLEEVFGSRQKTDDFFADDDSSGRSTPFGLGRGRDSLLSRTDQSDKDEEAGSRPSSVLAARRRRQSIHDMHRGVPRHTPSPHDLSSRITDELHHGRDSSANKSDSKKDNSEVTQLRQQLISCKQELEELQERYKELDEECETCAQYLREREDQCIKLKKEKAALEKQVLEMKASNITPGEKPSVASVAVNTDEDWANLHAVVVDRMSYDAEVEKNKKLTKTIEELRYQKQDLKNTLGKMQKALEKQQAMKDNRELEATKKELKSVKAELEELKVKYKELDDECETCSEYLKEREEQCRRLKEAKATLESKLQELQEDSHALAHYSVRKKRQTVHDMHRSSVMDQTDASTETNEDLLSNQVERDDNTQKSQDDKMKEIKRLRMIVEKLSHQKQAMEQQLKAANVTPQPMYVATGSAIVQNQQLTDVMKENQRLKKINAKLVNICKKRGKSEANRENEDPCDQG